MFNQAGNVVMLPTPVDVGSTVQNPGLVADLCKIIERQTQQSQEIANMVHIHVPPIENASLQPHMSLQITELSWAVDTVRCIRCAFNVLACGFRPTHPLPLHVVCTLSSLTPTISNLTT